MVSLLGELFAIEEDFAIDPLRQRQGLELLLDDPDATVLVCETGGRVAGMASMQRLVSTASGGYVGLIEDVVVSGTCRGEGIGTMLLESLITESRERGYLRLALAADGRNTRAIAFYRRFGFGTGHMGLMYALTAEE
jgi:ribosomal protein S18 acetylase RimI-like enzyme